MIKDEKHPDGTWHTSKYHYKDYIIMVKSKKDHGMKAHVFKETEENKPLFTLRYSYVNPPYLINRCIINIEKKYETNPA